MRRTSLLPSKNHPPSLLPFNMKLLATFLCLFLLLLFLGTLSYVYLLWHQYWQRVMKLHREQMEEAEGKSPPR